MSVHEAIGVCLEYDPDQSLTELVIAVNKMRNVSSPHTASKSYTRMAVTKAIPRACLLAGISVPSQLND